MQFGGETRLEIHGASEATDRYEIEIAGGSSAVTVPELDPARIS